MNKFIESFKNKNFACLWLAQIVSQFGDRISQMALIGLVAGRAPGSTFDLAKLLSFSIIPVFIVGPVAGVYVDRWDRRVTLFVCDFLRALLVLTIPFIFIYKESMIPIYAVVFFVFCLSRFYVPAKMSIIPDLVEQKDLLMANSLVTTTGMIAFVLGVFFGGIIVEISGPRGGFIWNAITFLVSGLLVASISREFKIRLDRKELLHVGDEILHVGKEVIYNIKKSVLQEFKEGVAYLVNHKDIRFIINMMFILFAAAGSIYVVLIVFIQKAFGSITRDLALLAPFLGGGLFCGSLLYGRWGQKISRFKMMFLCLIAGGVMLVIFAALVWRFPSFWLAAALAFLLGLVSGPVFIAANTVVHEVSDEKMLGKVFSSLEIVMHFGFLSAMLVSACLAEYIEHFWILIGVGVIFSIVGLVGLLRLKFKPQVI